MINGSFSVDMEFLCGLIAVIDENNNCACNSDQSTLTGPLSNVLQNATACSATQTSIGIPGTTGNSYTWLPGNNLIVQPVQRLI